MRSLSMRIAPLNRRLSLVGTQSGSGASAATRFFSTASADWAALAISAASAHRSTPNSTSPMITSASSVISL